MSDIQGNHFCKYAESDEVSITVFCKKSNKLQDCGGVIENCELQEEEYTPDNPDHERP